VIGIIPWMGYLLALKISTSLSSGINEVSQCDQAGWGVASSQDDCHGDEQMESCSMQNFVEFSTRVVFG